MSHQNLCCLFLCIVVVSTLTQSIHATFFDKAVECVKGICSRSQEDPVEDYISILFAQDYERLPLDETGNYLQKLIEGESKFDMLSSMSEFHKQIQDLSRVSDDKCHGSDIDKANDIMIQLAPDQHSNIWRYAMHYFRAQIAVCKSQLSENLAKAVSSLDERTVLRADTLRMCLMDAGCSTHVLNNNEHLEKRDFVDGIVDYLRSNIHKDDNILATRVGDMNEIRQELVKESCRSVVNALAPYHAIWIRLSEDDQRTFREDEKNWMLDVMACTTLINWIDTVEPEVRAGYIARSMKKHPLEMN